MTIHFHCPECNEAHHARDELAGVTISCKICASRIDVPGAGTRSYAGDGSTDRPPQAVPVGNPWTPTQILAGSLFFGPLAGGALAGINFARLGARGYQVVCIVAGAILFLLGILVAFRLPDQAIRPVGLLMSLAIAGGFALGQKQTFDRWKEENWTPASKANGIGRDGSGCCSWSPSAAWPSRWE